MRSAASTREVSRHFGDSKIHPRHWPWGIPNLTKICAGARREQKARPNSRRWLWQRFNLNFAFQQQNQIARLDISKKPLARAISYVSGHSRERVKTASNDLLCIPFEQVTVTR
jgi:hypothetical protein